MMFSNSTIARMRARAEGAMVQTCHIEKETSTRDELGASVHSWARVSSDVVCRVITVGSRNQTASSQVGGGEAITERYRVVLPSGTSVGVNYRLVIGGVNYQVVDVIDRRGQETDVQCVVVRERSA